MKGSAVGIKGIQKSFGDFKALNDVNLEIKKGEFFSLLGPSGCGKTTLLRMIAGFETPDKGEIMLDSKVINKLPPNKRPVNTIFQTYALFPHLNVFENVAFSLRLKGFNEKEIKEKVIQNLELVKLTEHINKLPSQMSGGQKQRVSIARALVNEPSVLLLDEPLSALDAKLRQHMLIELDTIHDKVGITFIFVTHDQSEALSVSDRIAVMKDGDVLQVGTPFEIYESPANSFVADFIGETNFIEGKVVEVEGEYATINSENYGELKFYIDKPIEKGNYVKITIRPEKIRATKQMPKAEKNINILSGIVEEVIYTGFQSKFFVKTNNDKILRVFKQHVMYFMDEPSINWKDEVYMWWNANDSYIVEVDK